MNSRLRLTVVIGLTLAFAVIAPLVITATAGYRYNWKKGRPEMTGVIKLDSQPTDANIVLNGQDQGVSTPYSLFRLLPGSYEISLNKDGYFPWTKTLPIRSGETVFTDTVPLFRQSTPERVGKLPSAAVSAFSPDETMIGAIVKDTNKWRLVIADRDGGSIDNFFTFKTAGDITQTDWRLNWSSSSDWLLVGYQEDEIWQATAFPLYGERQKTYRPLNAYLPAGTKINSWRWLTDSNRLMLQTNRGIFLLDPTAQSAELLTAASVSDTALVQGQMYSISSDRSGATHLSVTAIYAPNDSKALVTLPPGKYRFTEIGSRVLTLTDERTNAGYLYDFETAKLSGPWPATRVTWQKTGQRGRLLLWNDYEIYSLNASGEPELLLRVGTPLIGCAWHSSGRAIFYATAEQVKAVELDNRDRRNSYTLIETTDVASVSFSGSGKVVRVIGKWQNQFGLYAIGY